MRRVSDVRHFECTYVKHALGSKGDCSQGRVADCSYLHMTLLKALINLFAFLPLRSQVLNVSIEGFGKYFTSISERGKSVLEKYRYRKAEISCLEKKEAKIEGILSKYGAARSKSRVWRT
jgi:hypothetical protein